MDAKTLLFDLSAAAGAAGLPEAADAAARALGAFAEVTRDPTGGLVAVVNPAGEYTIMLDAHVDEIGFVVTAVEEGGFLRVAKCGGADLRVLAAQEVTVHGAQPLFGVFCSVPPHLRKGDAAEQAPDADELLLDVGLETARARELIQPGDAVTLRVEPAELAHGLVTGKSLDNRAGCAAVLLAAERFAAQCGPSDCRLIVSLSSQEELGCRGAKCAAFAHTPDEAVAVDVSFGNAPGIPAHQCGRLGAGPMIGISPVLSRAVTDRLKQCAQANQIAYQIEVMGGETSTNADVIAAAKGGVACGLVSIPLRSMHTPAEVVDLADVESTARLLARYVLEGGVRRG